MRCITALAALVCAGAALAQAYPARPIRFIIPFPPGGSNDVVGRMIAQQLGDRMGQPFVVDNRGGAGGVLGTDLAAKSPPDGYTLLLISSAYAMNVSLYKLPYDHAKAFAPVAMLGTGPNVLTVTPGLPVHSLQELLALAKQKPGTLYYASAGIGSFQHLGSALFVSMAGIDVVHVPFKGGGPAMMDVIAGNTQFQLSSLIQTTPQLKAGRLRALGVGGQRRSPLLPDVPTIAEAGLPGYEALNWWGILAPAGTSAEIVNRINRDVAAVIASPETKRRFASEGAEPLAMSPAELGAYIIAETAKWAKVIKEAGIRAE